MTTYQILLLLFVAMGLFVAYRLGARTQRARTAPYGSEEAITGPGFASRPRLIVLAVLIVCLALLVVVLSSRDSTYANSPEGRAEAARQADEATVSADEMLVKIRLRDPASAQFIGSHVVRKNGKEGVCGFVNAKNGFGGMTGVQGFAVIGVDVLFSDESYGSLKAVNDFCHSSDAGVEQVQDPALNELMGPDPYKGRS